MMAKTTDLVGIVEDWLDAHGYNGLKNSWIDCGCAQGDLVPCGTALHNCEPAYKFMCVGRDNCDPRISCDGGGDYCMWTSDEQCPLHHQEGQTCQCLTNAHAPSTPTSPPAS